MLAELSLFEMVIVLLGSLLTAGCALLYFQRVRLERPPVGVFNARDILILLTLIVLIPLLYVNLPIIALTCILVLTFAAGMYIALRPLMRRRYAWLLIVPLLAADIWVARNLFGTDFGWQLFWVLNNIIVLLAAVGVANLYIQGGMRMRHVAWFALGLAVYDFTFSTIFPVTASLADHFLAEPLDPSIGFRMSMFNNLLNANIGLGDLLVYALFAVSAYKGFGRRGALIAFPVIVLFGAIIPSLAPLIIHTLIRSAGGIVIPAQTFFGPVAFLTYLWLKRRAPERSMAEWYKVQNPLITPAKRATRAARPRPVEQPALADVQSAAQGSD